jgi:hypothetical protein
MPPTWDEVFSFPLPRDPAGAEITLTVIEARLFMEDEARGRVALPLCAMPLDGVLLEWVPVSPARDYVKPMDALVVVHAARDGAPPFEAPRSGYVDPPPWDTQEVTQEDFWRLPPALRPPPEESRGFAGIFEDFFAVR